MGLQRVEKVEQILFVARGQIAELLLNISGFVFVTRDRRFQRERFKIVHETGLSPQTPQGSSPQLVGSLIEPGGLDDSIAGSHVVEQEVAEGMNDLVCQRLRYCELSSIDNRAHRSGDHRANVTGAATNLIKHVLAVDRRARLGERGVARWNHRSANELSEVIDVSQPQSIRMVLR